MMSNRVAKSLEALTALSFSVLRRVPTLGELTGVTIERVEPVARDRERGPTWRLNSIDLQGGATRRQIELAEAALEPWRERYDLV
jgi:hypothetical protein